MLEHRTRHRPPTLSPELAAQDPDQFKILCLENLGQRSALGAKVWNFGVDHGVIRPETLSVDPTTWVSRSSAQGNITVGAQPMSEAVKNRVMFHGERFSYPDEVAYKLLHESAHSFLFLIQHSEQAQSLMRTAANIRRSSNGQRGLTALGSLDHYQGDSKVIEDATEIMTMYAWNPDYMAEFTGFLANPSQASAREAVGLISLSQKDSRMLYGLARDAVEEGLAL